MSSDVHDTKSKCNSNVILKNMRTENLNSDVLST